MNKSSIEPIDAIIGKFNKISDLLKDETLLPQYFERKVLYQAESISCKISEIFQNRKSGNNKTEDELIKIMIRYLRVRGIVNNSISTLGELLDLIIDKEEILLIKYIQDAAAKITASHQILQSEAGIYEENGIWYFDEMKSPKSFPKIFGKNLTTFPSQWFLHRFDIIPEQQHAIKIKEETPKLFQSLGLQVATREQENQRWMKVFIAHKELLAEHAQIYFHNDTCYVSDTTGVHKWPKIHNHHLEHLLPRKYLIDSHIIKPKAHSMKNKKQLIKMLELIGFTISFDTAPESIITS